MPLQSSVSALIGNRKRGLAVSGLISKMQTADPQGYQAVRSIESAVNDIYGAISDSPSVEQLTVVDANGNVLAQIGDFFFGGVSYSGAAFSQVWIGPNANPATAPFFSDGQIVALGKNGQVFVLDAYANIGAWLGTQSESARNVTGAVDNGSGLISLTVIAHGYVSGDQVNVVSVGGVPNATGQWIITIGDVDHITLVGSVFAGAYTSGGTVSRYFAGGLFSTIAVGGAQRVTAVANNGSGLIRVTVIGHGYATGYAVVITGVEGVPNINGFTWPVTVIGPDTFDLVGSVFSGAYTSGGLSLNWPTAKLIARDDGSLAINNATITVIGLTGNSVVIDPSTGSVTCTDPYGTAVLDGSNLTIRNATPSVIAEIFADHTTHGGVLELFSSGGVNTVKADGATGVLNVTGGFSKSGVSGISPSFNIVTNVTPTTGSAITSVSGTGVTSTSGTFLTGFTLTLRSTAFSGGIITT